MSVLSATAAGVRHHRRWLVRDLDLVVEAGETVAVVGPPGSGRTSAVLALARRLRLSQGKIDHCGTAVLGHVAGVNDPEPVFTVHEHVKERLALLGRPQREAGSVPLHGLDPELRGRDLTPYQRQVLGLVLAGLSSPALVALDGVDAGLDGRERAELWGLLGELTAAGVAVLVTAREVDPARVDRVVRLNDPQGGDAGRVVVLTAAEYAVGEPDASAEPAATEEPIALTATDQPAPETADVPAADAEQPDDAPHDDAPHEDAAPVVPEEEPQAGDADAPVEAGPAADAGESAEGRVESGHDGGKRAEQ
ncbi:ATP-binding cassette domain-containing protein [Actinoplanes palleronii]|uniref:ABC transporter domain-containing protein n=1 Tax=Actinoplanes palleronii TaxID=113570 RepID=A0ABQ4B5F7_9ACTN|nr:ATP-binding cassette domain-containing protein [Actinoplanes palleronii]GIE65817.1 hypothetical protein Apa02nite_019250 [Actinoplanes palleronii]